VVVAVVVVNMAAVAELVDLLQVQQTCLQTQATMSSLGLAEQEEHLQRLGLGVEILLSLA
jgi:hypothetical protein